MRLYCPKCGKVTQHQAASGNNVQCAKCERTQPTKTITDKSNMPPRKRENGSLTNSKRYKEESEKKSGRLKNAVEKVADTAKQVGETAKTVSTALGTVTNAVNNVAESVGSYTANVPNRTRTTLNEYGGLSIVEFKPQEFLAPDLFTDSSSLQRTTQADADAMVNSIEEKRQTVRVATANLALNTDILKAGVASENMVQTAIDYGIAKVNTETKLVQYDTANVLYDTAVVKLHQAGEKLVHEQVALEGLKNETDQRRRFWNEKYQLGESRIKQVQLAKFKLDAKIGEIETSAEPID